MCVKTQSCISCELLLSEVTDCLESYIESDLMWKIVHFEEIWGKLPVGLCK